MVPAKTMSMHTGSVLKGADVRFVPASPAAPPPNPAAEARIVEQTATGLVIEVTCPCGRKTQVHCEYPAAGATA